MEICNSILPHVTHVDSSIINKNSYMKSKATFGLGNNL